MRLGKPLLFPDALLYGGVGAAVVALSGVAPPMAGALLVGSCYIAHKSAEKVVGRVTQHRVLFEVLRLISIVGAALVGLQIAGLFGYAIVPLTAGAILCASYLLVYVVNSIGLYLSIGIIGSLWMKQRGLV